MSFEIGSTVDGYEFLDILSSSKTEIRYRVRNVLAQRMEVLRILPKHLQDDQERVERFLREMKVHARMVHPNIVTFYNAAELQRQLVMTTELIEGVTLAQRFELGPLPWREAVRLVSQALEALAFAHGQGIVHRDIAPQHMIVTPEGTLKIADFGLAKTSTSPVLTQNGAVLGTLKYISPEQVKGSAAVDGRSDLYSLGVILYEAVAGKPPFDSSSQFELMLAHVAGAPGPPSAINPAVPSELERIILKAIAKDPAQRFQSAHEFRGALEEAKAALERPVADALPAPAPPAPPPLTAAFASASAGPAALPTPKPVKPAPVPQSPPLPAPARVLLPVSPPQSPLALLGAPSLAKPAPAPAAAGADTATDTELKPAPVLQAPPSLAPAAVLLPASPPQSPLPLLGAPSLATPAAAPAAAVVAAAPATVPQAPPPEAPASGLLPALPPQIPLALLGAPSPATAAPAPAAAVAAAAQATELKRPPAVPAPEPAPPAPPPLAASAPAPEPQSPPAGVPNRIPPFPAEPFAGGLFAQSSTSWDARQLTIILSAAMALFFFFAYLLVRNG